MGRTGSSRDWGSMAAPPAAMSTTMVSPMARDMPSMMAVPMPDRAAGTTTRTMVSQRVAPSAREASRRERGTARRASSETEQMVGRLMMASTSEALSRLRPVAAPSTSWRMGASTTMPRKPSTTEGRAASSSTKGLMTRRAKGGAISARYTAVMTPRGTASSEESTVTATEPTSNGKMPNRPGSSVGYQRSPSRKSSGLTCRNRGRPSVNRKMTIPASASRDEAAMAVRQMRMARSWEELNMVFSEGFLAGRARWRKREKAEKRGKGGRTPV